MRRNGKAKYRDQLSSAGHDGHGGSQAGGGGGSGDEEKEGKKNNDTEFLKKINVEVEQNLQKI